MVHRSTSLVSSKESLGFVDIDHTAVGIARRDVAYHGPFTSDLAEAEYIGEDRARLRCAVEQQCDAVEAANGMLRRDVAVAPAHLFLGSDAAD